MMRHVLMLGLLPAALGLAHAQNLVANPSFELGTDAPEGWNFNHRNTEGEIAWDDQRAATGQHSVRLTNAEGQTGNVLQTIVLDPPLPAGSTVEYAAMSATLDAGGAPSIIMYLQPPAGERQTVVASGAAGTHDFQEVRGLAVADRPVASIVIYLCHYGTGTAWWDDARVSVAAAELVTIRPRPAGQDLPALATDDGLALTLTDAGGIAAVRVDDTDLAATALPGGLFLVPWGGDAIPVTGALTQEGASIAQRWEDADLGLRVEATWSVAPGAIACAGAVDDLTGADRAVDVIAALPIGGEGWRWAQNIVDQAALDGTARALDDLTFSALVSADGALSLAVPADRPSDCSFEWTPELGYAVRFRLGLSPAASGELRGRAPFAFTLCRVDPAWGLRDAARRYQEMNAWAFEKRAQREGLWLFGSPRIELPDPELYAFHEGGPAGWEYDDEHGIATCPYVIPGQREITRLERLPASAAEALELFEAWVPGENPRPRGWGDELMKQIIRSCMLHNADGDPHVVIRNTPWGGNSVTFPLNANPWLHETEDTPTVARTILDAVRSMHEEIPALDGIYVDSLGAWGDFDNFRREHFAAERLPLTYDAATGRPVIDNSFTLLEFLQGLGELLHPQGKLVFGNGIHPDRRFHAFVCDVLGVEGRGRLEQKRTIAGAKPFLLLIYNIENDPVEMERWFNACAHWGIYPSFGNMRLFDTPEKYAPVAELNRRYVPAMQTITAAGWQPVTQARASEGLAVERWGPGADGAIYLTVYNATLAFVEGEVTVNADALGLTGATLAADDLLGGPPCSAPIAEGAATLRLPVEAGRVRILRLSAR